MIEQKLIQKIKKMEGNILGICVTESMVQTISNNNKIINCDLLDSPGIGSKKTGKTKQFHLKKLRKRYHHKRLDAIVAEIEPIERFFKTFVRDSVYVCKGQVYLYTNCLDYDYEYLETRYRRFGIEMQVNRLKDGIVFVIPVYDAKNHYWKEKWYYIVDLLMSFIDFMGDVLAS